MPFIREINQDYFPNTLLIAEKDELGPINHRLH